MTWKSVKMEWKSNLKHMHCTFVKLFFFLSFPQHDMSGCLKRQMNSIRFKKGGSVFYFIYNVPYPNCSRFDLKTGVILEEQTLRCSVNCRQAKHSIWRSNGLMQTVLTQTNRTQCASTRMRALVYSFWRAHLQDSISLLKPTSIWFSCTAPS